MNKELTSKIQRTKELLASSKHISIATVNKDGSPHNSPVFLIYDPNLEYIYWGSHPESLHSINVARTGQIFAVLYDRIERGGLYIKAEKAHMLEGQELERALAIHNEFRAREGLEPLELAYYEGDSQQRMWGAQISNFWVNYAERDTDGHVIKDGRFEITAKDLLE